MLNVEGIVLTIVVGFGTVVLETVVLMTLTCLIVSVVVVFLSFVVV